MLHACSIYAIIAMLDEQKVILDARGVLLLVASKGRFNYTINKPSFPQSKSFHDNHYFTIN